MSATVTYTSSGFSPASVTIKQGGTVTFVNQGGGSMDIASDPHPNHNGYDGTSRNTHCAPSFSGAKPFDQCRAGASFSFTFTKVGSWGYHNHLNEADGGVVNVVQ
jgi:plastocyanin